MILESISKQAWAVFLVGFVTRVIAWCNTSVINPDGALFIHQARAIYYGQTDTLFCALNDLSNLPVLIAGSYWIFHDWVLAARFVSFAFGFGTLVPVYYLLKHLFDDEISVLGTLVLAVMPVFVGSSVDIIRDPISWFFIAAGLCLFIASLEENRASLFALSCVCFMMASWARIEASLLIVFSLLYLGAIKQEMKVKKILAFLMPIIGLLLLFFMTYFLSRSYLSTDISLISTITSKFTSPLSQYHNIQNKLSEIAGINRYDTFGYFVSEIKKNVWLIALGSLLNRCLEAFFYPFFAVCIVGIYSSLKSIYSDKRMIYMAYISSIMLLMLYCHMFRSWFIDYRHVCLLILPCTPFIAFGIRSIIDYSISKIRLPRTVLLCIVALCIIAMPLYKNSIKRDSDKRVFLDIGNYIRNIKQNSNVISIATSCSTFRVISFYTNLDYPGAPCPEGTSKNCWEFFTNSRQEFLQHLKSEKIEYFLSAEKLWPTGRMGPLPPNESPNLRELKRWHHPDTGEMILFEVL